VNASNSEAIVRLQVDLPVLLEARREYEKLRAPN
jgi:hypothetical protein